MFGAALAVAVMPTLGWHWYLGIAATPLALVLLLFPVRMELAFGGRNIGRVMLHILGAGE